MIFERNLERERISFKHVKTFCLMSHFKLLFFPILWSVCVGHQLKEEEVGMKMGS